MSSAFTVTQIITLRAPSYASDARLPDFITLSEESTSDTAFGDSYNNAVALRVMHWLALEEQARAGVGGAVTQVKTGDLSMSFANSVSGGDLLQTSYGMELKALINTHCIGARNAMVY